MCPFSSIHAFSNSSWASKNFLSLNKRNPSMASACKAPVHSFSLFMLFTQLLVQLHHFTHTRPQVACEHLDRTHRHLHAVRHQLVERFLVQPEQQRILCCAD